MLDILWQAAGLNPADCHKMSSMYDVAAILHVLHQFKIVQNFGWSLDPVW